MSEELTKMGVTARTERLIWRYMGVKSARQIADDLGLEPEEVLRIKRELLDEVDVLSNEQQRRKLMMDMQEVAADAIEKSKNVLDERNYAPMLAASTQAMKTALNEMNRIEKATQDKVDRLNRHRINELVRLIQWAIDGGVEELDDGEPHTAEEMYSVFNKRLMEGAALLEDRELES